MHDTDTAAAAPAALYTTPAASGAPAAPSVAAASDTAAASAPADVTQAEAPPPHHAPSFSKPPTELPPRAQGPAWGKKTDDVARDLGIFLSESLSTPIRLVPQPFNAQHPGYKKLYRVEFEGDIDPLAGPAGTAAVEACRNVQISFGLTMIDNKDAVMADPNTPPRTAHSFSIFHDITPADVEQFKQQFARALEKTRNAPPEPPSTLPSAYERSQGESATTPGSRVMLAMMELGIPATSLQADGLARKLGIE